MIVTLTINPAIDRILSVDRLAFEDRAYISSCREAAGGRGINASCVIHAFGGRTTAVLVSGGASGKRLEGHLRAYGYPICIVPIRSSVRTNLTVTDRQGLTVNLNEAGPVLTKPEVARVARAVHETLSSASWLLLCGSIPPGVPASFYAELIAAARRKEVKTLLHTGGDALPEGIQAKPTVAMPNQQEAERLLDRALLTRTQYLEAAERIRSMGAESVILSLGSQGAVAAFADGIIEATPPRVKAVCPIGAGDALAAGYTWSIQRKSTVAEALRWAVAAGTATARLPGLTFASLADTQETYRRVEVRRAE